MSEGAFDEHSLTHLSEQTSERLRARVRELAAILVQTPTPSGNEAALYPFLTGVLQACGFRVERQMTSLGRENLVARRGQSTLLFSAHVDTYPAYTHPEPYRLRQENDRPIGRGVADCKGQIAALLCAVELVEAPCQIAFGVDEERKFAVLAEAKWGAADPGEILPKLRAASEALLPGGWRVRYVIFAKSFARRTEEADLVDLERLMKLLT